MSNSKTSSQAGVQCQRASLWVSRMGDSHSRIVCDESTKRVSEARSDCTSFGCGHYRTICTFALAICRQSGLVVKPRALVLSTPDSHLPTLAHRLLVLSRREVFLNMSCISSRINEDVVQIYHYADVQQVLEDAVHKVLEGGSLGETGMHNKKFIGAVSRAKGVLPFALLRLREPSCKRRKGPSWRRCG